MLRTDHPLLDGLEFFGLPVNGLQGGSRLYDLSPYRFDTALQGSGTTTWGSDHRLASKGVVLDGEAGAIASDQSNVIDDFTFLVDFIVRQSLVTDGGSVAYEASADADDNANARNSVASLKWSLLSTGSIYRGRVTVSGTNVAVDSSTSVSAGDRCTIVLRRENGVFSIHVNGTQEDSSTQAGTLNQGGDEGQLHFGLGSEEIDPVHDAGMVVGSAYLSTQAHDAQRLTTEARRGFPALLRRRDQSALYVSTAGAGVNTTALFSGAGTQSVPATKQADTTGILSGGGEQSAPVEKQLAQSESLTASGQILSSADKDLAEVVTFTSAGAKQSTADKTVDVAVVLAADGRIQSTTSTGEAVSTTAQFTGGGTTPADESIEKTSVALFTADGSLVAVGAKEVQQALQLTGTATAGGIYTALKNASATISQVGTLQAGPEKSSSASSQLTGAGQIGISSTTAELGSAVDVVELDAIWDRDVDLVAVFDLTEDLDAEI